ncbi:MAG: glycerophosphodiester phosphodiesterase, partial [Candidatus Bathyarchaeia archaeon]
EALDFLDRKSKIFIEIKEVGIEEKVLEIVRRKGLEDNVIIISFYEEVLKKVRDLSGTIKTGLIYVRHKDPIGAALSLKAQYLLPMYKLIFPSLVRKAHDRGLKVIVWTINTPEEAGKYAGMGVDGIASDKPDILKNL